MSRFAYKALLFLPVVLPLNLLFAGDDAGRNLGWLQAFFEKGIQSASAQYSENTAIPGEPSDKFYQRSDYTVDFDFKTRTYTYHYAFEYRDKWEVLTGPGGGQPPKQ